MRRDAAIAITTGNLRKAAVLHRRCSLETSKEAIQDVLAGEGGTGTPRPRTADPASATTATTTTTVAAVVGTAAPSATASTSTGTSQMSAAAPAAPPPSSQQVVALVGEQIQATVS
jgi:hypothetical protein